MKHYYPIIVFLFLVVSFYSYGQDTNISNIITSIEDLDIEDKAKEDIIDELLYHNNNQKQINLNQASQEELMLLGLNNFQIFSLINYIQHTGQLFSLNELSFVNGFDKKIIDRITPYVYVEEVKILPPLNIKSISKYGINSFRLQYSQNLNPSYGYTRTDDKGYKGDAFSSSFRYYFKYYDRMEFSIVGDKDYGEPLYYKNKTYGYDSYNISFTLRDLTKHIKQVTLGDYRLNIGEGLFINQNYDVGYFSNIYGVKKKNNRIMPFRSTSEYNYNKGFATQLELKNVDVFLFSSFDKIDYNGNILSTGYHRTERELSEKDSNSEFMAGSSIQYINKGFNLGVSFLYYTFKDSIFHQNSDYQKYYFLGKENDVLAINASYSMKKMIFFTEMARSMNAATSYLLGLQWDISYKTNLSLLFRNYDKRYHNIYADAVGMHNDNQNERGVYLGFSRYMNKQLSYFLGMDYYYFPFLSYRANKSSNGEKIKLQVDYNLNNQNKINFYSIMNNHQYNDTTANGEIKPLNNIVLQSQIRYTYSLTDELSCVFRCGYSKSFTNDSKKNYGFYDYVEMIYRGKRLPIDINVRYTLFRTKDYDNRFYVYEYSLPLNYSSSLLYNNGNKFYALLSYNIKDNLSISCRYSLARYNNTKEISSGNNLVKGNLIQYLAFQVFYKF